MARTAARAGGALQARGQSFLVGLIGAGVGQSLTPPMHEQEAADLGHRLVYRTIDIAGLGLPAGAVGELVLAAHRLGFNGLNITHPCKQLVLPHLDRLSREAEALGAVNTVVFSDGAAVGHNTDWSGFARALADGLPGAAKERVVLLGAGGAGSAVAHALMVAGAGELAIADADFQRAAHLAEAAGARFGTGRCRAVDMAELSGALSRADGLVHATPTGMAAHPGMPLPAELLRPELWVADIVYRPIRTALLRQAANLGCATLDGGRMAVFQAAGAFELITGLEPDARRMLDRFGALLAAEHRTPSGHPNCVNNPVSRH